MFRVASLLFLLACIGFAQALFVRLKAITLTSVSFGEPEVCTYYVSPAGSDTNSGTIDAPWRHLQKAFETLTAGQTACLRAGTYEPVGVYNTPSYRQTFSRTGKPGNPIVIRNYPGETAIVLGEVIVRGSYLKLSGSPPSGSLIFQGPLGPDVSGVKGKGDAQVWLDRCNNVVLDHVEIRNNDYHAGLYVSEVSDLQLYAGSGRITGLTIIENTIVKAMNSGVIIGKGADGNVFANNIVSMNSQQTNNKQIRLADNATNNIIDTKIAWHRTTALEGLDTSTVIGSGNVVRNLMLLDPYFVNLAAGDYHLRPGSPAINVSLSGDTESADIDGVRRPSRPSLGAYEYRPPQ